jgi:small-conductance mechanosensitive channel
MVKKTFSKLFSFTVYHCLFLFIITVSLVIFTSLISPPIIAQTSEGNVEAETNIEQINQDSPTKLIIDGRELFTITQSLGTQTISDRVESITEKIIKVAQDPRYKVEDIRYRRSPEIDEEQDKITENNQEDNKEIEIYQGIIADDLKIMQISPADAESLNTSQAALGSEYTEIIQTTVRLYRQERNHNYLRNAAFKTLISTILFVLFFSISSIFFKYFRLLISKEKRQLVRQKIQLKKKRINIISRQQSFFMAIKILNFTRLISNLFFAYFYLAYTLDLYPWTRQFSRQLWSYFLSSLNLAWTALIDYLPNSFVIIIVVLITRYCLIVSKSICDNLENKNITLPGFYPEWSKPTYRLLAIFIIALSAIISFPYLPGFGSPAFQGISLFLGVLVSLGSTAVIANVVAGIILIYTRSFQVGDRVQMGETMGDVEEKSLLVTRIRTSDNIIITIPNSALISNSIVNYSASIRETARPVMLTATVTIGYDVPWVLVHQTLINAALATERVEQEPLPIVLQTALNNYYVTYALKACTNHPNRMSSIISGLYQNIQDHCNQAGIEILSPAYSAMRDGNHSTMPKQYLDPDYESPSFLINPLGNLFQIDVQMKSPKKHHRPR